MFSCKKAAKLASKQMDGELSFIEKMSLKAHLMMCAMCTNYTKQLRLIRDAVNSSNHTDNNDETLSEEIKDRLRATLKSKK